VDRARRYRAGDDVTEHTRVRHRRTSNSPTRSISSIVL
jgi:hypothetical protein